MLRASFAGGIWALLLSTSGLSFASVMTEIPDRSDWAVQTAAMTSPVVAPATQDATPLSDVAPVVATIAPMPVTPKVPAAPSFNDAAPLVMASFDPMLSATPQGTLPGWTHLGTQDSPVSRDALSIAEPILPPMPMLVTLPAPAPVVAPTKPDVFAKSPAAPLFDDLIIRVQADTNTVVRRLPQILPEEPDVPDAPEAEQDTASADPNTEAAQEVGIQIGTGGGNILEEESETPEETGEAVEDGAVVEDTPPATALGAFAADFENPNNLPLIGVVLVDDGSVEDGPLRAFESGFVSTVAIDALRDDATLWSEAYREAGMEIAMQVPLPMGVQPSDVEVTYAAAMDLLPEAAFLFSSGEGVLRNDRKAAQQVMSILATDGYGFVTLERGLGSLVREAARASVPVAQIWRQLDGNDESVEVMSRTLDRAAFTARQSGSVVVVARLTPLTMEVLTVWALNAEREGVLLAPVSALLLASTSEEGAVSDAPASSLPQITE